MEEEKSFIDLNSLIRFDILKDILDRYLKKQNDLEAKLLQSETDTNSRLTSLEQTIDHLKRKLLPGDSDFQNSASNSPKNNYLPLPNSKDSNYNINLKKQKSKIDDNESDEEFEFKSNIIDDYLSKKKSSDNNLTLTEIKEIIDFSIQSAGKKLQKNINDLKTKIKLINTVLDNSLEDRNRINEIEKKLKFFDNEDNDNAKMDMSTALIKSTEKKLIDKTTFIDNRIKKIDENLNKLQYTVNGIKSNQDSIQLAQNNLIENVDKSNKTLTENISNVQKALDEKEFDLKNEINECSTSLKKLNFKVNETLQNNENVPNIPNDSSQSNIVNNKNQVNTVDLFRQELKQSISNSENYIKSLINDLRVGQIQKDVVILKVSTERKLEKKDLTPTNEKIDDVSNTVSTLKNDINGMKLNVEKINALNNKVIHTVEMFGGVIEDIKKKRNYPQNLNSKEIDTSNFATYNDLAHQKNLLTNDIKKNQKEIEESKKYAIEIEKKMSTFLTRDDFHNIELCLKNDISEFKYLVKKKYADKFETQKSFKYFEAQIKDIIEHLLNVNSNEGNNDNVLLAKKPLSMFHCASCDSFIGDLNNKVEYIPWNKLKSKDDNNSTLNQFNPKYRMGHGFSKMLQMINTGVLKSIEQYPNNFNSLPKINFTLNKFYNANSNSNSNMEYRSQNLTKEKENEDVEEDNNRVNSGDNGTCEENNFNTAGKNDDTSENKSFNIPKLVKIYKKK